MRCALHHLLAVLQQGAALGQKRLLPRLGRQRLQLLDRMAQEALLGLGPPGLGQGVLLPTQRAAPGLPGLGAGGGQPLGAGIGVEHVAMGAGVEQPLGVELAMHLDQPGADLAQQADRHRLVVDEGAAAAVGADAAAQHQRVVDRQLLPGQEILHRMSVGQQELGADGRGVRPVPHQPGFAAAAEGEAERVEQDRLAGPGLAGQRRQAFGKAKRKLFDQNHIPDRKSGQHGIRRATRGCGRRSPSRRADGCRTR
jgi:hypothetical protein